MKSALSHSRSRRRGGFILGGLLVVILVVGIIAYNLLTLNREAAVLRRELFAKLDHRASTKVEATAGPVLLSGVRTAAGFFPDFPAEAREALGAVRSASVGVYEFRSSVTPQLRREAFAAADLAMERRGWSRLVSVSEKKNQIAIYVPSGDASGSELRVCLAVCENRKIVIVSATVDADNLSAFVQKEFPQLVESRLPRRDGLSAVRPLF